MKEYNLPAGGIEVAIPGDYKPKLKQEKSQKAYRQTFRRTDQTNSSPPRKPLRYIATRSLFITCGLATLGNIPVYSMIHKPAEEKILNLVELPDKSSPAQVLQDLNLPAVAVESFSGFALDVLPDARQGNWSMHEIENGDKLAEILGKMDLGGAAEQLLENTLIKQELSKLKSGQHLFIQTIGSTLQQLIYTKDNSSAYIVSITDDGYSGEWEDAAIQLEHSKTAFTVTHSIRRDGKQAGLSSSVLSQIIKIFREDLDIDRHAKVGDTAGVIFEEYKYRGESIYTGKILAAEYNNRNGSHQRVRFTLSDGKTNYFRPDGDTELKRIAFDRKPIKGGRMSSGFGMRRHPILGYSKLHTGVDYAAPRGTPIYATADGHVKFLGRKGGYGKTIVLQHGDNVTTLYGHMSDYKKGIGSGDKVKRGDIIGYVGSTGTSTGNHVHYEYRINDKPHDPLQVELPSVGIMSQQEILEFGKVAAALSQELADLRKLASLKKPLAEQAGG